MEHPHQQYCDIITYTGYTFYHKLKRHKGTRGGYNKVLFGHGSACARIHLPFMEHGTPPLSLQKLESFQKRSMTIIYPILTYNQASKKAALSIKHDRRKILCQAIYKVYLCFICNPKVELVIIYIPHILYNLYTKNTLVIDLCKQSMCQFDGALVNSPGFFGLSSYNLIAHHSIDKSINP